MRIGIMSDLHIEFERGQMRGGARPQGAANARGQSLTTEGEGRCSASRWEY